MAVAPAVDLTIAQRRSNLPRLAHVAPDPTCPGRWIVVWALWQHGGCHFNAADAQEHAARLSDAEAWDYNQWLEDHGYGMV